MPWGGGGWRRGGPNCGQRDGVWTTGAGWALRAGNCRWWVLAAVAFGELAEHRVVRLQIRVPVGVGAAIGPARLPLVGAGPLDQQRDQGQQQRQFIFGATETT